MRAVCSIAVMIVLLLCAPEHSLGQNISGVINEYAHVLAIDSCLNTVTVASSAPFAAGDRVLIIQMTGASVDHSQSPAFGSITSMAPVGSFEYASVRSTPTPTSIRFDCRLLNHYDPILGQVQLVRIPQYASVTVTGTLTPKPWDKTTGTGGIVMLEASGTVTLDANVNADGAGFAGGIASDNGSAVSFEDYYSEPLLGLSGRKGDGIALLVSNESAGRGAAANGGGGGNSHNSGGGGGSNLAPGGNGGDQTNFAGFGRFANGGVGAYSLGSASIGRLFLGGGGGGGHQNNGNGSDGGAGGGIVIIRCMSLATTNTTISARGISASPSKSDGAGGGGAGGMVAIITNSITGMPTVDLSGGNGGDANSENFADAFGPGGGGAAGSVFVGPAPLSGINLRDNGGASGSVINCTDPKTNATSYGASAGSNGIIMSALAIPQNTTLYKYPDVLQPTLSLCAGDTVTLQAELGDGYAWSPTSGLSDPSSATPHASPSTSTLYHVTITRGSCTFVDSVSVTVDPRPVVAISASTTVLVLPGGQATLTATAGFPSYLWSSGETTNSIVITTPGTYTVTVTAASGCTATDSIVITSAALPASIDLALPVVQGKPGDHVFLRVSILSSQYMNTSGATLYTFTLRFNGSLLAPVTPTISSSTNGRERTITVAGTRSDALVSGVLDSVEFIAALGDTTETRIYFDTIEWTNGAPVHSTMAAGVFKLLGICPEGGNRLFSPTGTILLGVPHPNPARGYAEIDYQLLEEGETTISLYDMLGRNVLRIVSESLKPGSYVAGFDVSMLPDGMYSCVLRTPSQMRMHRMEVFR